MKFPDQVQWLQGMGRRLGCDLDDNRWFERLAEDAGIPYETMRKYVGGYQPMPDQKKVALELVEQARRTMTAAVTPPDMIVQAYAFMPWHVLNIAFVSVAKNMEGGEPEMRKQFLLHLRAMLSELDRRVVSGELEPKLGTDRDAGAQPNSKQVSEEERALISGAVRAGARELPTRRPSAADSIEQKAAHNESAEKASKEKPLAPPTKARK